MALIWAMPLQHDGVMETGDVTLVTEWDVSRASANVLRSQGLRWREDRQHVAVTRERNRIRQVTLLSGLVQ